MIAGAITRRLEERSSIEGRGPQDERHTDAANLHFGRIQSIVIEKFDWCEEQ